MQREESALIWLDLQKNKKFLYQNETFLRDAKEHQKGCQDFIHFYLLEENPLHLKFIHEGCSLSYVSSVALCIHLLGKSKKEALSCIDLFLHQNLIEEEFSFLQEAKRFPLRRKCVEFPWKLALHLLS